MKWMSFIAFYLISIVTANLAVAEVPVTLSGPTPAIASSYTPGDSTTIIYALRNNVPNRSFPITISGISSPLSRVTVANDCRNHLPAGPSTCQIGINIAPKAPDAGLFISQTLSVNYQGRLPLTSTIEFLVNQIPPLITTNPENEIVDVSQTATFSTNTSGGVAPYAYQWQISTNNGTTFTNIAGANSATYTTPATTLADNNNQYHVIVTDSNLTRISSSAAVLTVNGALTTTPPANETVGVGQTATFSTDTSGGTTPYTYQWQISRDNGFTFANIAGAISASYTTPAITLSDNNNQYQVKVMDAASTSITSSAALLTVSGALTTTPPDNVDANVGQTATFSTTTSGGTTPYTYQWQVSSDNGFTFTNIAGATSASYTTPAITLHDNNNQYQVIVTDAASTSITSSAALLTVNGALTTTPPDNVAANVGQTATFSTTTSGGTAPYTYQWQVSTDNGFTFTNIAGATSASYTTPAITLHDNNNQYQVIVTDAASTSITSSAALLTVNGALTTTPPDNVTANVGQTATFSTSTSGGTAPYTYQWQVSTDNGSTFTNIVGATSTSYTTAPVTLNENNNQYQVIVRDAASTSITSAAALLNVS
jgi:hypothetical protein